MHADHAVVDLADVAEVLPADMGGVLPPFPVAGLIDHQGALGVGLSVLTLFEQRQPPLIHHGGIPAGFG